ncbi:Voltage-gated Ion Channel (VIC) Superfamily [Diplonema papillatum]|nr:Voltage-gated Ion Channel (VIC) Superfamily [Diplonema papillatum]
MPDKSVSQASLSDVFQETPTFVSPAEEHDGEIDSANDSQCSSQPLGLTGAQIPETPPDPPPSYFAVSETPIRRGTGLSTEEDTEQSLGTAPDHTYVTEDIPDIVPCSSFALIKRMERLAQVNTKARPAEFKSQGEVHQWLKDVSSESEEKGIALGLLGANVSYLQRERYQGNCCSILAILATLLVTADFAEENSLLEAALSFVTIMHLASLFFLYRSEQRRVALWQRGSLLSGSNRSRLLWCVAEVLTVLTHRPMRTAVPRILNIVVFLRLFTLARSLRNMSFASSASSMLIGALCNTRMDVLFVYKTHLFKSPIKTMIITSGAGFVLLSLLTWFVEKTYGELNLAQCFWYTFVTATTVGYGDYTPASVGGKLVGMVSAV